MPFSSSKGRRQRHAAVPNGLSGLHRSNLFRPRGRGKKIEKKSEHNTAADGKTTPGGADTTTAALEETN